MQCVRESDVVDIVRQPFDEARVFGALYSLANVFTHNSSLALGLRILVFGLGSWAFGFRSLVFGLGTAIKTSQGQRPKTQDLGPEIKTRPLSWQRTQPLRQYADSRCIDTDCHPGRAGFGLALAESCDRAAGPPSQSFPACNIRTGVRGAPKILLARDVTPHYWRTLQLS